MRAAALGPVRAAIVARVALVALIALGGLAGCGEQAREPAPPPPRAAARPGPGPGPPAPPKPALADAAATFQVRCATCHGELGDGHGPASAGLDPPPRDLRDPAWQDAVSDAHIEAVIARGGAAAGLSPAMPPHPDLAAEPGQLAALRAHVRSLRR
jgi:hypothetical protein